MKCDLYLVSFSGGTQPFSLIYAVPAGKGIDAGELVNIDQKVKNIPYSGNPFIMGWNKMVGEAEVPQERVGTLFNMSVLKNIVEEQ